jgi:hypothetical protein
MGGVLVLVTLLGGLLVVAEARACFDLEPPTPAERGAATRLALGMAGYDPGGEYTVACYGFKPFGLRQINFGAVSVCLPLSRRVHSVGISYQRLEAFSYAEETHEIRCAFKVRNLGCSPAIRLGTVRSDADLVDYAILFDVALEARPREGIKTSFQLKNPFGLGMRRTGGPCPTLIAMGLGYLVTGRIGWGAEIRKQGGHETSVAMGIEWALPGRLRLRAGLRTYPEEFCLGIGLSLGGCVVDVATSCNLNVGNTHEFGVAYRW